MNLDFLIEQLNITDHFLAVILGLPRIFMIFQTSPFLGGAIVTGSLRMTVALACYIIVHPMVYASLPSQDMGFSYSSVGFYSAILLKETLIGVLLGLFSGILFWSVQGAGFFIDNQRGASQAMGADPLSSEQTTPLGSFLFQCIVYIFFVGGAFMVFLELIYTTYEFWPIMSLVPLELFSHHNFPLLFASQVSFLMTLIILLSGPIVMACLLTDISLGLMNRFAPQLNVYVLAMPIKSGVASFLLIFYFGILLNEVIPMFHYLIDTVYDIRDIDK